MYLSFYGLNKKPFQISVDPSFLWMGEKHKEALAMLKYGIMDNRGFVMLTGDVGTGKTTLVNALTESLGPNVITANITNPGLKQIEFINHLATAFDLQETYTVKGQFLLDFALFLEKSYGEGKQVLLIVDEAQQLSQDMLEEIRLLSNIEHQDVKLLNIFFVGQDELNDLLDRHENRALRQRMTLQYHLVPLSEIETGQFIQHRLKVAGTEKKIFSHHAIREIHAFSKGYPRLTNIICDHAMLSGYVANKKTIDGPEIRDCAKDLKLPRSPITIQPTESPPNDADPVMKTRMASDTPKLSISIYVVGIFLIILLLWFLVFPSRSSLSFSNIFGKLANGQNESGVNAPKQSEKQYSPTSRLTFKVEANDTESLDNSKSFQILNGENLQASPSFSGIQTRSGMEKQSAREEMGLGYHAYSDQPGQNMEGYDPAPRQAIPESERRYTITFEFDSNGIPQEGFERLDKTAEYMIYSPEIRLTLKGYTDVSGPDSYNTTLSKFRADIVKNYLVAKGITSDRITSIGKGAEEPIADNDDYWGRMANRRVEIEMNFN